MYLVIFKYTCHRRVLELLWQNEKMKILLKRTSKSRCWLYFKRCATVKLQQSILFMADLSCSRLFGFMSNEQMFLLQTRRTEVMVAVAKLHHNVWFQSLAREDKTAASQDLWQRDHFRSMRWCLSGFNPEPLLLILATGSRATRSLMFCFSTSNGHNPPAQR